MGFTRLKKSVELVIYWFEVTTIVQEPLHDRILHYVIYG
jgi:hypothetical protein